MFSRESYTNMCCYGTSVVDVIPLFFFDNMINQQIQHFFFNSTLLCVFPLRLLVMLIQKWLPHVHRYGNISQTIGGV